MLVLDNDDVFCLKFFLQILGECVVRDEYVDVFGTSKRIGFDFADLGAVEHHIKELCLLCNHAEEFRFHLRTAGESAFGCESRGGDERKLKIGVGKIEGRERGSRREVFLDELSAQKVDDNVLFLGKFGGNAKSVGKYVTGLVCHFFYEIEGGCTTVDEKRSAFVNKLSRFLRDDNLFICVHGCLFGVRTCGGFFYLANGHSPATDTNNLAFFFQLE